MIKAVKFFTTFAANILICATALAAPTSCPEHYLQGQAPDILNQKLTPKTRELCNTGYAGLHSGVTRTTLYAAEHLTWARLEQGRGLKRKNSFHADERLSLSERSELADYARSGYDRGHVAPPAICSTPGRRKNPLAWQTWSRRNRPSIVGCGSASRGEYAVW